MDPRSETQTRRECEDGNGRTRCAAASLAGDLLSLWGGAGLQLASAQGRLSRANGHPEGLLITGCNLRRPLSDGAAGVRGGRMCDRSEPVRTSHLRQSTTCASIHPVPESSIELPSKRKLGQGPLPRSMGPHGGRFPTNFVGCVILNIRDGSEHEYVARHARPEPALRSASGGRIAMPWRSRKRRGRPMAVPRRARG